MIKRLLRSAVYAMPGTQALWVRLNDAAGRGEPVRFSGWGMTTKTSPPWADDADALAKEFMAVNAEVTGRVASGALRLSQFNSVQDKARQLRELMWRHYLVFWSARYASRTVAASEINLTECGVCDGLTAYFAMSAAAGTGSYKAFLYDAWQAMTGDRLLDSEQSLAGQYAYLSLDNTRRNLAPFAGAATFVKGFVPDSFADCTPSTIAWLHIDLNAARPTEAALRVLFDRVLPGGVILFDDYGWPHWHDTKVAIDRFLGDKRGLLLPMPTGQAMFFKH